MVNFYIVESGDFQILHVEGLGNSIWRGHMTGYLEEKDNDKLTRAKSWV